MTTPRLRGETTLAVVTKLIEGTKPEADTLRAIQQTMGVPEGVSINLMVFEVTFKDKTIYCCWSGGKIIGGQPRLTLIGQAAMEALANLPRGDNSTLIIQELKLGPTPLRDKVRAAVMKAPAGAKVCFIGDMQGELDGHMHKAFNLVKDTIKVSH